MTSSAPVPHTPEGTEARPGRQELRDDSPGSTFRGSSLGAAGAMQEVHAGDVSAKPAPVMEPRRTCKAQTSADRLTCMPPQGLHVQEAGPWQDPQADSSLGEVKASGPGLTPRQS